VGGFNSAVIGHLLLVIGENLKEKRNFDWNFGHAFFCLAPFWIYFL
jgi:hypothetical protein